jgi:antitoxin component of MazEF toxin-antitoxin module
MAEAIEVKVRKIGTSLGVLIPKRLVASEHLKEGSLLEISLLKRQRRELINKYLGIAKGAGSFKRENSDRF